VLLVVLVVLGGTYVYLAAFHPPQRAPEHPYFDAPDPWVVAHRGGAALAPENTMAAFENAVNLEVDVLEMDLRVTADGLVVLMHDDTVDRTTDGMGRVAGMTLADLQELDAGYRFTDDSGAHPFRGAGLAVPTLRDVSATFPDIRLNVEMKEFTPEQAKHLCALLRELDALDRVLVSSFPHAPMNAFREACPEVATGATRREVSAFYLLGRARLGSLFRSPAATLQPPLRYRGRDVVTPAFLDAARESRRPVQVWTVNDEADMKRLLEMDVQAILTDHPDRLLALMGRSARPDVEVEGADQIELESGDEVVGVLARLLVDDEEVVGQVVVDGARELVVMDRPEDEGRGVRRVRIALGYVVEAGSLVGDPRRHLPVDLGGVDDPVPGAHADGGACRQEAHAAPVSRELRTPRRGPGPWRPVPRDAPRRRAAPLPRGLVHHTERYGVSGVEERDPVVGGQRHRLRQKSSS
jgi:glycerophosphoryl diester phosphodiesterase